MKPSNGGNACIGSSEAKENVRFRICDNEDILWWFIKILYDTGSGGSGGVVLRKFLPGPQQKPELLPVNISILQNWDTCQTPPLLFPQSKVGVDTGVIFHITEEVRLEYSFIVEDIEEMWEWLCIVSNYI